jgi:hypothetical protein
MMPFNRRARRGRKESPHIHGADAENAGAVVQKVSFRELFWRDVGRQFFAVSAGSAVRFPGLWPRVTQRRRPGA